MALKAAQDAQLGIAGLATSIKSAGLFVESVTDGSYYITGYRNRPPRGWQGPTSSRFIAKALGVNTANSHAANHTPTAAATICRMSLGVEKSTARLRGGVTAARMLPVWDSGGGGKQNQIDSYYWYYGTLAMFQYGGDPWKTWNAALRTALVGKQQTKAEEAGSWDPHGAWGFAGGRVYSTAINALSLEIYYRYPRLNK